MTRYIKVNYKVAQFLQLQNVRNTLPDGNFLLWQADMLRFGRLTELSRIVERIGGLALKAHEAKEEQDGIISRPLPIASDQRFVIDADTPGDKEEETGTAGAADGTENLNLSGPGEAEDNE